MITRTIAIIATRPPRPPMISVLFGISDPNFPRKTKEVNSKNIQYKN